MGPRSSQTFALHPHAALQTHSGKPWFCCDMADWDLEWGGTLPLYGRPRLGRCLRKTDERAMVPRLAAEEDEEEEEHVVERHLH